MNGIRWTMSTKTMWNGRKKQIEYNIMRWRSNKVSSISICNLLKLKLVALPFSIQPSSVNCRKYWMKLCQRWKMYVKFCIFQKIQYPSKPQPLWLAYFNFHINQFHSVFFLVHFCIANNVICNSRFINHLKVKYLFSLQFWNWTIQNGKR